MVPLPISLEMEKNTRISLYDILVFVPISKQFHTTIVYILRCRYFDLIAPDAVQDQGVVWNYT